MLDHLGTEHRIKAVILDRYRSDIANIIDIAILPATKMYPLQVWKILGLVFAMGKQAAVYLLALSIFLFATLALWAVSCVVLVKELPRMKKYARRDIPAASGPAPDSTPKDDT